MIADTSPLFRSAQLNVSAWTAFGCGRKRKTLNRTILNTTEAERLLATTKHSETAGTGEERQMAEHGRKRRHKIWTDSPAMPPRFELRHGKFGSYFHDTRRCGKGGFDMPLDHVLEKLNRLEEYTRRPAGANKGRAVDNTY